ncbi:MAG: type II toxin-antitoxin system RelE/ParE family toxin [Geobacter sp.]|nr:type II toxin-antitoxin system RelE/ParE family toxin [Geobacter sp.]
MRFRFKKKKLEDLYSAEKGAHKYPAEVIEAFFEAMSVIAAAHDERDLYALKGFHFEKLSGGRKGEHSLRLNKQFRLIVTFEKDSEGKLVLVIDIEDYH